MNELLDFLNYSFAQNALIAAILTSVIASIVGAYIVARRSVFISGGITHASFGGMGIAYYYGFPPIVGAVIFAVLSAVGIEWSSKKAYLREDSAIAILWSLGMAIGILFIFLTPGYSPNLMSFLFGDILTVTLTEIYFLIALTVIIGIGLYLFYEPILYTAFDPEFSKITKLPVQKIKYVIGAIIAITIVLSIKVMGIILVLSLFTIPPSAANLFVKKFNQIINWSIAISIVGSLLGLIIAFKLDIPTGASIIFSLAICYIILHISKLALRSKKSLI